MHARTLFRRLLLGAGLALAALAPAALGGLVADAQPAPPTISPIRVQAGGTEATVSFTSSEPVAVTITHQSMAAGAGPPIVQAWTIYTTTHETKLTGLTSNTAYAVAVTARTLDGRTASAQGSFTTAKKRLRIVLESIDIKNDGDGIFTGDGEPVWYLGLAWGNGSNIGPEYGYCYPHLCKHGTYGEGRFSPSNSEGNSLMFAFAEENFDRFPDTVSLSASAHEQDSSLLDDWAVRLWDCVVSAIKGGCASGEESPTVWRVPQGVETAHQILTVSADDPITGFESVLNFSVVLYHDSAPPPPIRRNLPHSTWR